MAFLNGTDPSLRQTRTPTVDTFLAGVGFTAGSSTTISLSSDPGTENAVVITFDGITQHRTEYSVSGTTVTFTAAIPAAVAAIEATYTSTIPANEPADNSVTNAKMADDAVGLAELSATGTPSSSNYLRGDNSWAAVSAGFTLATEQATTSGTSKTFDSIPAGTKMIVVMFEGVSYTADVQTLLTIGDAGGLETSGYAATAKDVDVASETHSTSAFIYDDGEGAAGIITGAWTLTLKDASNYTWVATGVFRTVDSMTIISGVKSLSAELTQLQISGGTFDAGSINVMYM